MYVLFIPCLIVTWHFQYVCYVNNRFEIIYLSVNHTYSWLSSIVSLVLQISSFSIDGLYGVEWLVSQLKQYRRFVECLLELTHGAFVECCLLD